MMHDRAATPFRAALAETDRESRIAVALRDTFLPLLISSGLQGKASERCGTAVAS